VAFVASGFSRKVLAAAAIVATVVLGAQTWHKAFRPGGNDLTSYLLSARALWDGQSPYGLDTPFPYIYPPFLAFVIVPLAMLPYGAAVIGWFAASVAALAVVLRRWAFRSELAMAAAVIVTFNVIQNNLLNGQVNLLVVLCCLMSIDVGRVPPSPGTMRGGPVARDFAAGLWLGAAIALKLMPALLLVYFLVRRQFRAIVAAGVTALVLALVPALLIGGSGAVESGFSRITGVYSQYARELLMPMMATPAADATLAYSVASVVQRVLGSDPRLWIDALCAAGVLGAVAFVDVTRWRRRGDDLAAAAAYMVAIVLISPKSETHHLAFAIPAFAWCFSRVFEAAHRAARSPGLPARRSRGEVWALLLSAVALVAAPFTGATEGPMITAAMVLLIAAVMQLSTSCIQQQA
jgi:alpha-1,2-mannosyltransferase